MSSYTSIWYMVLPAGIRKVTINKMSAVEFAYRNIIYILMTNLYIKVIKHRLTTYMVGLTLSSLLVWSKEAVKYKKFAHRKN